MDCSTCNTECPVCSNTTDCEGNYHALIIIVHLFHLKALRVLYICQNISLNSTYIVQFCFCTSSVKNEDILLPVPALPMWRSVLSTSVVLLNYN